MNFGNDDFIQKLKSGSLLPDEIYGWSTKTVLAVLLGLLLAKIRMSGKNQ